MTTYETLLKQDYFIKQVIASKRVNDTQVNLTCKLDPSINHIYYTVTDKYGMDIYKTLKEACQAFDDKQ